MVSAWLGVQFLMIEFMLPLHPKAHFRPTDGAESPGRVPHDPAADAHATNAELANVADLT